MQTQAVQPPKASARVAIVSSNFLMLGLATQLYWTHLMLCINQPKTSVIKPAAKSARLPTSSKMKARKASQAVDWCADDSFSFS
jgi:hypothetical protein